MQLVQRLIWPVVIGALAGLGVGPALIVLEIERAGFSLNMVVMLYAALAIAIGASTALTAVIVGAARRTWAGGVAPALAFGASLAMTTIGSCAGSRPFSVGCPELQVEGEKVVGAIQQFYDEHGAYPPGLAQLGLDVPATRYGPWSYELVDHGFRIRVGEYGRDELELSYSSEHGWYCDT